jgi:hypothetical protein
MTREVEFLEEKGQGIRVLKILKGKTSDEPLEF